MPPVSNGSGGSPAAPCQPIHAPSASRITGSRAVTRPPGLGRHSGSPTRPPTRATDGRPFAISNHRLEGGDQAAGTRAPLRLADRTLDPVDRQPAGDYDEVVIADCLVRIIVFPGRGACLAVRRRGGLIQGTSSFRHRRHLTNPIRLLLTRLSCEHRVTSRQCPAPGALPGWRRRGVWFRPGRGGGGGSSASSRLVLVQENTGTRAAATSSVLDEHFHVAQPRLDQVLREHGKASP